MEQNNIFLIKNNFLNNPRAQGIVETLFVTILFLTGVVFAMVQLNMIGMQWLRANEAAQGAARCAAVNDGTYTELAIDEAASRAAMYVLGPKAVPGNNFVTVWYPEGDLGQDRSGEKIKMLSGHIYYFQKIMFGSLLQPLMGDNDLFVKSQGRFGHFYGGDVSITRTLEVSKKKGVSTGAAHARFVKSPDRKFLNKAWPDAKKFDE